MTEHTLIKTETLRQVLDAFRGSAGPDEMSNMRVALQKALAEPCEPVGYATYCGATPTGLTQFKPDFSGHHPSWYYRKIYAAPKEPT